MKIKKLSVSGITTATATTATARDGRRFFAFAHGDEGRGRWQVRFPLASRDFPAPAAPTVPQVPNGTACPQCGYVVSGLLPGDYPCPECRDSARHESHTPPPASQEYALVDLKKTDPKGNGLYLLTSGRDDGDQLILWSLSPGFRGGASYEISGQARVIAEGYEAQGDAGRMGGAPCPVVLVTGPCRLTWTRSGRLYGEPAEWTAEFDGAAWHVAPVSECCLEQAVFA